MARFYDVFPNPPQRRPPWPKIKGAFWARHLGSRAGRSTMIHRYTGGFSSSSAMHRQCTDCPQAPWPEEQSWLKRKTFAALPRKSCRLNRVVTLAISSTLAVELPKHTARPDKVYRQSVRCGLNYLKYVSRTHQGRPRPKGHTWPHLRPAGHT
jgi:hypothetical protein